MRFIERLNTPVAVIVVLAFFLALDGFLLYSYQQHLPTAGNIIATQPPDGIDPTAAQETTAAAFVHRATSENVVTNSTYVNHPLADGNPNAILLVERVSEPGGDPDDVHNVGVWYDAPRGKWAVFNQDRAPMSEGTTFDVAIWEEPGGDAFVHRATPANIADNETYVDSPSTNGNPDAVLSVTPSWNPRRLRRRSPPPSWACRSRRRRASSLSGPASTSLCSAASHGIIYHANRCRQPLYLHENKRAPHNGKGLRLPRPS